jgi:general secretion pathway protein E/type IV pilus assembly protein PilB
LLGQALLQAKQITPDQLAIALAEQARQPDGQQKPLGELLLTLGFVTEEGLWPVLASLQQLPYRPHQDWQAWVADQPFGRMVAERFLMISWQRDGQTHLATAYPKPAMALREAVRHGLTAGHSGHSAGGHGAGGHSTAGDIHLHLACPSAIRAAHAKAYPNEQAVSAMRWQVSEGGENSAVDLVDEILQLAIRTNASDIHLQPEQAFVRIRLRQDGRLVTVRELHKERWAGLLVRLKLLAEMNITESRLPQDGRLSYSINGRAVDMRVATQPTLHGENLVVRLLDRPDRLLAMTELGFEANLAAKLTQLSHYPQGLMVISGPTGSGKTTTLYALLRGLDAQQRNIMTLEEPVEAVLAGVRQTPVRDDIGFGFAEGIRALMRQDPDVIMVGEIRDEDTAHMALRAALTGHLVLTTLHSHDSIGIVSRLLDFGVAPGLLAESWLAGLAQRLLRRLCESCMIAQPLSPAQAKLYELAGLSAPSHHHQAVGCPLCDDTGYRGRLAVGELLPVSPTLADLIASSANRKLLRAQALMDGQLNLRQQGLMLAATGQTSLAEVERVLPAAMSMAENIAETASPLKLVGQVA